MNLQEQISRIQSMMGLVNENIDDILDKIGRGEELSKEDKDKMDAYNTHLNSGGNEQDFNYEPEVAKEESGEIDYESLLNKLIYNYLNELFKNSYYVRGSKQIERSPEFLKLFKTMRRMRGDDEDEEKATLLNKYTMVGYTTQGVNICILATEYNLLNSDRNIFFSTAGHILPISKFIKNYVDTTTDQNIKDSYENEGLLFRWYNLNNFKDDEKRLIDVVLKWVNDKFGEMYDEGEFVTKGIGSTKQIYFKEFINENGIDGYVKDL